MINPFKTPFQGPGDEDLKRLSGQNPQGPDSKPNSANDLLLKSMGGGVGSAGKKVLEDRARSVAEQVTKQDTSTPEMEKANTPGPDNTAVRGKATLIKVCWLGPVTQFNSDAEINAEFDVPASEKGRTLVDFQVLRLEKGGYKPYGKAQGHLDDAGQITVKVPIRKSEDQKSTFIIKVKHCTTEWSSGQGTERDVTETTEISFEHIQVSGLHFPKEKSFISDDNLNAFSELKKTYLDWKKSHEKAQIIVYGHSEADKDGDPHPVSRNRAFSAFAFIIGDVDLWAELAEKERWGTWEQQCMLRALGFFKVKPTGNLGPITRQATQDFITFLNETYGKNFNPMLGFTEAYIRKELYREYMNLNRAEIGLPSSAFRLVSGYPYVGCSAFNRYRGGEDLYDENRRAVFIILQESRNFPVTFPCRSSTIGPCEEQCRLQGERASKSFRCQFYSEIFKQESQAALTNPDSGEESNEADNTQINYSIEKAVAHLDANSRDKSQGSCARYVRLAIEAGGGKITPPNPLSAKDYGPKLAEIGFKRIDPVGYTPQKGDVVVFHAPSTSPHGHIQMFNGTIWVSDFRQQDAQNIYPGSKYREEKVTYDIFRP